MREGISVITPAYRAERTLARAVKSVLAQSFSDWELIVVADDDADYEAVLGRAGLMDSRFRFFATGASGSGSPPARNIGLDKARYRYSAILDADDLMHAKKLALAREKLETYGIVSTALQIADAQLSPLRTVGDGADRLLGPGDYKFTNISMDSMLVYDRQKADPRFDPGLPRLTDIDFLLKLFARNDVCFHLGKPLHTYVKEPDSISNAPGATLEIIEAKKRQIGLLKTGHYPLAAADGLAGMIRFWELSLKAEQTYGQRLAANPALLFEDHLDEALSASSTSPT